MELNEVIKTRRSIRSFKNEPVSDDLITTLLEAAMCAPSAGNQQPWHFIVIRDRKKLDYIPTFHPYTKMLLQAEVAILVCGDPDGKMYSEYWMQDCSAATMNILLSARDLGLGTVWAGVYPNEDRIAEFRKLLGIPGNIFPFSIIPVGWPKEAGRQVNRFKQEFIHKEMWNGV